eukprot:897821-Pyramimonas_sp.AAC.1
MEQYMGNLATGAHACARPRAPSTLGVAQTGGAAINEWGQRVLQERCPRVPLQGPWRAQTVSFRAREVHVSLPHRLELADTDED